MPKLSDAIGLRAHKGKTVHLGPARTLMEYHNEFMHIWSERRNKERERKKRVRTVMTTCRPKGATLLPILQIQTATQMNSGPGTRSYACFHCYWNSTWSCFELINKFSCTACNLIITKNQRTALQISGVWHTTNCWPNQNIKQSFVCGWLAQIKASILNDIESMWLIALALLLPFICL